jgi:hypothetical protein
MGEQAIIQSKPLQAGEYVAVMTVHLVDVMLSNNLFRG